MVSMVGFFRAISIVVFTLDLVTWFLAALRLLTRNAFLAFSKIGMMWDYTRRNSI